MRFMFVIYIFLDFVQYNATYFATYKESGIRRISLAESSARYLFHFLGKKIWLISQAL